MINKIQSTVKNLQSKLTKGSFGHNVLVMFAGTALGQFASILLAPFLTRIYSPEEFGVLGTFSALLMMLSVVAALRYEMALTLSNSSEDALNVFSLCVLILIVMTSFATILVFSLPDSMFGVIRPYRILLPIGFFFVSAYNIMIYYATREQAFKILANTKVAQGWGGAILQIILGLCGAGGWGLVIGFIAGQSIGVSTLIKQLIIKKSELFKHVSIKTIKEQAIRFIDFPRYSSWAGLVSHAGSGYMLFLLLPFMYSAQVTGYVFLIDRLIARPLALLSTSILQVFMGEIGRLISANPRGVKRRFLQLVAFQTIIVSSWLLLVNLVAADVFPLVFGKEWLPAVPYLRVLTIAILPQMIMSALGHTLQSLEKQAASAIWEIGRCCSILGGFAISAMLAFAPLQAMMIYSVTQACAQIILFIMMYAYIQTLQTAPINEI